MHGLGSILASPRLRRVLVFSFSSVSFGIEIEKRKKGGGLFITEAFLEQFYTMLSFEMFTLIKCLI